MLPDSFGDRYRLATDRDVHASSFGRVERRRAPAGSTWREQVKTLEDPRIFGPVREFECACGKYVGREHDTALCDMCGVKLGPAELRRTRCGHIDLPMAVPHPLGQAKDRLGSVTVLPASFLEAPSGNELAVIYEGLVVAREEREIAVGLQRLTEILLPTLQVADDWDLSDRRLIARGVGLVDRADEESWELDR
ncbi:MAG TPA: hypothetical protein VH475_14375 [Tepidisphaeraceae bacterium]|jgi:hypothetical protein